MACTSLIRAHKIIYLISPPRSLSVAFLRMMQARNDFVIFHEPSLRPYAEIYHPGLDWWSHCSFKTFQEAKKKILEASDQSDVFVKEVGFAVHEFLLNDDILTRPDVYVVFLLRNPHDAITSFYRESDHMPVLFSYFVSYQSTYDLFYFVKERGSNPPLIIKSDDLVRDPEQTVRAFCNKVGIPFVPESMSWQDLGHSFLGEDEWHEAKKPHNVFQWHRDAIRSEGFHVPRCYDVDSSGNPTFQEVKNEHRHICAKAYNDNLPLYKKMLESGFLLNVQ